MIELQKAVKSIKSNIDHSKMVLGFGGDDNLKPYDFVISGITSPNYEQYIGYVVQVRKGWGAFGSDMVLVRKPDGELLIHENQCFWLLTDEQIKEVLPLFKYSPDEEEAENPELSYSVQGGDELSGFIIPSDNAPDRVDSFSMTITTKESPPAIRSTP